jgi:predicted transcriptional regulator
MPRRPSSTPNDVELAILRVLWARQGATVRQVHDVLKSSREAGYTGTLKMMQVMCEKGLLVRDDSGRPQIYRPAVPEEQTQRQIVRDLIQKAFGGSTHKLMLRAVQTQKLSAGEMAEIRKLLEKLPGGKP